MPGNAARLHLLEPYCGDVHVPRDAETADEVGAREGWRVKQPELIGGRARHYEGEIRIDESTRYEPDHRTIGSDGLFATDKMLERAVEKMLAIIDKCEVLQGQLLSIRAELGLSVELPADW